MPAYKIFRMKDAPRQQFRWAPHTSGVTPVKPKDYEEDGSVETASPYAAWFELKESARPLDVGDLLEAEGGELRICKYVGFEEARWILPEPKLIPDAGTLPPQVGTEGAEFRA
jgi:hypothetical protein